MTDSAQVSNVPPDSAAAPQPPEAAPPSRLKGLAWWLIIVFGSIGIFLNVNQLFNLQFFMGALIIDTSYYYLLAGIFLGLAFLIYPAHGGATRAVPWYDWLLFVLTMGATFWLAYNGERIVQEGWEIVAPFEIAILSGIFCLLALEGVRRVGGLVLFIICGFFFIYPLFSESMPGFMWGPQSTVEELVLKHALGTESIIGVPMRVVAGLLIGFLIFGSALVVTGGGEFFMAFATALMGRSRGGPAKVAILSSGFFGSLSGSVISNVVTTGQLTIPTMKRVGYPATYAGAVEACASTGGALMPPVMGAVAFIMAEYLNVPYSTVMVAAIVPALLFYIALLLQADNYAARNGLQGQPAEEIPDLWATLKQGWHFLISLVLLVYMLLWGGYPILSVGEAHAPYVATLVLLATSFFQKTNRFTFSKIPALIEDSVKNISNIVGVLAGIGLIVGSLSFTGVGGAFSGELVQLAGSSVFLLLIFGAFTSFILGMGMTVSACYIFLAIVLGPALKEVGLNPVASHLFILYWGMLSYITPPVALAAVAASTISKSNAINTGFLAMRLGLINFILPFLFVLSPTLILDGEPIAILHDVTTALIAVWLTASAFEGWLYWSGRIGYFVRGLLLLAALGFLDPGPMLNALLSMVGLGTTEYAGLASDAMGAALLALAYVISLAAAKSPGSRAAA
jgi:TRAP transporter 4TM/12TM fusion protein